MVRAICKASAMVAGLGFGVPGWGGDWALRDYGPFPPVAPYTLAPLPSERVVCPMIFPVVGKWHYRDGYGDNRGGYRHTAIDIAAPKMTPIVAPFSGVLGMKRETFWIYGDNGWAVLGTHLNDDNIGRNDHAGSRDVMFAPDLTPGMHVQAGRFIGYVGMSGDATGPHLHFELFKPGDQVAATRLRDPFYSLKYSQHLSSPRVFMPDKHERPKKGQVRFQGCVRKVEPKKHRITLLLTAVQESSGASRAVAQVRYLRANASDSAAQFAGGWESLENLRPQAQVALYAPAKAGPAGYEADRIVVSTQDLQ